MSFMVTARSFRFRWLKLVAGIRRQPNDRPASPRKRPAIPACVGHLRQCSTSRATRAGDESRKARAKIPSLGQPSRAHACADFRELIIVRRTKYSRALNIGLHTGQLKEGAITTPPTCRKTRCAKYTFRPSKRQLTRALAR